MGALSELGVEVIILARPVEIPVAIPFNEDEEHRSYDAAAVHRFWFVLASGSSGYVSVPRRLYRKGEPRAFLLGRRQTWLLPVSPGGERPSTPVGLQTVPTG